VAEPLPKLVTIDAPWTPEQVAALQAGQEGGRFHPYTCSNGCGPLTATTEGWVCSGCDYRQTWAHSFSVQPSEEVDRG